LSQRPPPHDVRRHLADEFADGQRSVVAHDGLWPDPPAESSWLAGLQARQLELELPPEK
jgi:hypothetical protein